MGTSLQGPCLAQDFATEVKPPKSRELRAQQDTIQHNLPVAIDLIAAGKQHSRDGNILPL